MGPDQSEANSHCGFSRQDRGKQPGRTLNESGYWKESYKKKNSSEMQILRITKASSLQEAPRGYSGQKPPTLLFYVEVLRCKGWNEVDCSAYMLLSSNKSLFCSQNKRLDWWKCQVVKKSFRRFCSLKIALIVFPSQTLSCKLTTVIITNTFVIAGAEERKSDEEGRWKVNN